MAENSSVPCIPKFEMQNELALDLALSQFA
jgi:hypothetical protein